jgi:hypothetical protein
MLARHLLAALAALSFSALAAGCAADAASPSDDTASESEAVKSRICPAIWAPVCGKDGKTYSSECAAGGEHRVAYEGECNSSCKGLVCTHGQICEPGSSCPPCVRTGDEDFCHPCDPIPPHCVDRPKHETIDGCAAILCIEGTHCESNGGHAACVRDASDPCALVRCASGTHCEASGGSASCVPDAGACNLACVDGYHCELQDIVCITTPCDPIPACVPTLCSKDACGPALGLATILCDDGSVGGNTGNCLKKADGCGWEIRTCPTN